MTEQSQSLFELARIEKETPEKRLLEREPELMRRYLDDVIMVNAIQQQRAIEAGKPGRFTHPRQAIGAIEEFLNEAGKPLPKEEIIQGILEGGYAPKDKRRRYNLVDALRYHTETSKRVVIIGDDVYALPSQVQYIQP